MTLRRLSQDAKNQLHQRVRIGHAYINRRILDRADLQQWREDFRAWADETDKVLQRLDGSGDLVDTFHSFDAPGDLTTAASLIDEAAEVDHAIRLNLNILQAILSESASPNSQSADR